MYHFFVPPDQIKLSDKSVMITGSDVNHIKNVLRMRPGDEISVSNGLDGREYRCGIEELSEEGILCRLRFIKEDGVELPVRVYLFQALPKADKMEMIIQKAVELGVYRIIPVAAKRCVVKLDEKKAKSRIVRWQGIAEAAAKQSKRAIVPQVENIMSFSQALQYAEGLDRKLIPYELAEGMDKTRRLIEGIGKGQSVAVFIGPEGGFEEAEISLALERGMEPVTLGKRILRTETAGLVVLSWLIYRLEE